MRNALLIMAFVAASPVLAQDYQRGADPRWQSQDDRRAYERDSQYDRDQDRAQREMDAQRRDLEPSDRYERGDRYDRDDRNASREGGRYEAQVTSVRAVVAESGQHCWVERERVAQPGNDRSGANVPGAVVGAIVGGVLGHQIGGGHGKDIATAGGAVGGGLLGANVGRDRGDDRTVDRDVQHCRQTRGDQRPEYWDVTYTFHGQQHRAQLTYPPGETLPVNRDGEPM